MAKKGTIQWKLQVGLRILGVLWAYRAYGFLLTRTPPLAQRPLRERLRSLITGI